jgi:hypothetical protein
LPSPDEGRDTLPIARDDERAYRMFSPCFTADREHYRESGLVL